MQRRASLLLVGLILFATLTIVVGGWLRLRASNIANNANIAANDPYEASTPCDTHNDDGRLNTLCYSPWETVGVFCEGSTLQIWGTNGKLLINFPTSKLQDYTAPATLAQESGVVLKLLSDGTLQITAPTKEADKPYIVTTKPCLK